MNGFLDDHDDFELARRLRRAAGPTPDVYVAYDNVVGRVATVRRRRRVAVTGIAGVALVLSATSYAFSLRSTDRKLGTAAATTDVTTATTEPSILAVTSTIVVSTTIGGGAPTTTVDAPGTTVAPAVVAPDPVETTVAPPTLASEPPAPTLPPATAPATNPATTTRPPTSTPPKPPKPPTTTPPVTEPATTPPTDPPVETTTPPTDPPTTPPTTPPTVAPTDPPVTVPDTEPPVPVPPQYLADSYTSPEGNSLGAVYSNGQLSIYWTTPAAGWVDGGQQPVSARKVRVTFQTADGTASVTITVTVDSNRITFSTG